MERVKTDIILAGVGGQGILTIAAVLGKAALASGLRVKQAEVHGMAQRGGAVQSHFRMSSETIHSDVIPKGGADFILAMEPMEALRYMEWLKDDGWVVVNESPVENIPAYPDLNKIHAEIDRHPHVIRFDGKTLAKENGSPRALNMAMLGAGSIFTGLDADLIEQAIADHFAAKGEKVVENNLNVFRAALELAQSELDG